MLNIKVIDGDVYAIADGELSIEEDMFMFITYEYGYYFNETGPGKHRLTNKEKIEYQLEMLDKLVELAKGHGISIGEEFDGYYADVSEKAKKEEFEAWKKSRKKEYLDSLDKRIKNAQITMRDGCGWCYYKREREGRAYCTATERFCRYKEDELEEEFYARREAKAIRETCEFYATAYPCVNCPKIIEGQRAFERKSKLLDAHVNIN
jgi:hypothetical protein